MSGLKHYRPNVGVVLFNAEGKVWIGRRAHTCGTQVWQFPQGGVDDNEDLFDAALRELEEETGVTSVRVLGRIDGWLTYDFPADYAGSKVARGWKGQKQAWFALEFTGADSEVCLDAHEQVEFAEWRWADLAETPGLVIPFKREVYEQVAKAFAVYGRKASHSPT